MTLPLTTIVLTFNEEQNLGACLASMAGLPTAIFVVDSGSTDATRAIAEHAGATVVEHPFEGHARQWNWALRELPATTAWVLCLDADQRLTPELRGSLEALFAAGPDGPGLQGKGGFYIARRQIFRGVWIRHGGYYPKYLLKLVRRDEARSDVRERMDHRFYVTSPTGRLSGDLIEDNRNEQQLAFWIAKHERYAWVQAQEEIARRAGGVGHEVPPTPFGTPDQRVLWQKQIWYRLPLFVRPVLYFWYRYVVRLGCLDGREGFLFHGFQAFWYRVLVDAFVAEHRLAPPRADAG